MIDYECTNPQRRRIEKHKEHNEEIWESEDWKERKAEFLREHPTCRYCGSKSTVPHHPDIEVYGTPAYLNLAGTIALCNTCHRGIHERRFQCPECSKVRAKSDGSKCYSCLDENDKLRIAERHDNRIEVKNKAGRTQYLKAHPTKKIYNPKTGQWVSVKR